MLGRLVCDLLFHVQKGLVSSLVLPDTSVFCTEMLSITQVVVHYYFKLCKVLVNLDISLFHTDKASF